MKILRDHPIPLFITVLALILAGVLLNHAWEQDVDITLTATEYRLDDPDYAVEHTVTLRGRGARNFFGKGRFEGTVSISGLTGLKDEQAIVLSFPKAEGRVFLVEGLVSLVDESGEVHAGGKLLGPVFPSWDYTQFVWFLADKVSEDGASYGGRYLISGPAGREAAFALAAELTRNSPGSPCLPNKKGQARQRA